MYELYSTGARTEPCGTPAAIFLGEESSPSTETLNCLLIKKEANSNLLLPSRYIASGRTTAQKTSPLPSNGRPLLLRIRWNVFTQSLLSNGHAAGQHRKHLLQHLFYCCVRVSRALPSNAPTLLLVAYLLRACLPSRCLAMGICVTIHTGIRTYTDLQAYIHTRTYMFSYLNENAAIRYQIYAHRNNVSNKTSWKIPPS
jgi:hypothetical protein